MPNKNDRLVIGYYEDVYAAESAAYILKDWDHASDDIRLGAIAILTLDPASGEIQSYELGQRETKSGALWGTAIGAAVGILTAGVGLIPAMLLGAGGGAAIGALKTESVKMDDEDRERILDGLRDGKVGLAVMADDHEVAPTTKMMVQAGGRTEFYKLTDELAEALTEAARTQEEAAAAIDERVAEAADTAEEVKQAVAADVPGLSGEAAAVVSSLVVTIDISAADADRLRQAGIEHASALYKRAATPEGRGELAEETGLDADTIYLMEKKLDLMRVKGVGPRYSTLLIASGVETVPDLARRNAENLHAKMAEVNEAGQVVEVLPSEEEVPDWVEQAKELPRVIVT